MKRTGVALLAAGSVLAAAACANIWGFQSVTVGDAGADSTSSGGESGSGNVEGSVPEGGCGPSTCSGCCAGDLCVDPPVADYCGKNGQSCMQCGNGDTCLGGTCTSEDCGDTQNDPSNCGICGQVCGTGPGVIATCVAGGCMYACTSGYCSDGDAGCTLPTTNDHCGSCGVACDPSSASPVCVASGTSYACGSGCPDASPTRCGGVCVDTTSTAGNCGGCATGDGGHVCTTTDPHGQPACVNSACTVSCNQAGGYTLCGGSCIQLNTSANCGLCGVGCSAEAGTPVCVKIDGGTQYQCGSSCPTPEKLCGGVCTNTQTDVNNCNTCGNACTTSVANGYATCTSGNCGVACNAGYTFCSGGSGACVDVTSDQNNCGSCGHACSGSTPICSNGTCVNGCPTQTPTICSGVCTNTVTDPNNCNACGVMCPASVANAEPACVSGDCTFKCNTGYAPCNGACVNEQIDRNNCGGCGSSHACATGLSCVSGACTCVASGCPSCSGLLSSPCCKSSGVCGCSGVLGGCN